MTFIKPMILALLTAAAFAVPAFAGGDAAMMQEKMVTIVMPNGQMSTVQMIGTEVASEIMKSGRVVSSGQMIMMSGGKVYMMDDKNMPDGTTMSTYLTK